MYFYFTTPLEKTCLSATGFTKLTCRKIFDVLAIFNRIRCYRIITFYSFINFCVCIKLSFTNFIRYVPFTTLLTSSLSFCITFLHLLITWPAMLTRSTSFKLTELTIVILFNTGLGQMKFYFAAEYRDRQLLRKFQAHLHLFVPACKIFYLLVLHYH